MRWAATPWAAVGSAFTLMTFLTSVFLGLAMGAGALFSIYLGRKDMASLHRAAALALCLIGGVTAAVTALVYVLLDPILRFLQVPDSLYGDHGRLSAHHLYGAGGHVPL